MLVEMGNRVTNYQKKKFEYRSMISGRNSQISMGRLSMTLSLSLPLSYPHLLLEYSSKYPLLTAERK
jgi:hypothetical protein